MPVDPRTVALALALAGCGGTVVLGSGSGDSGNGAGTRSDGGSGTGHSGDTGSAAGDSKGSATEQGGGPVDAGLYHGPGSYFVDGGAYRDAPDRGLADARVLDATPGCATLAACCPTLAATSQSLCDDIVAQGKAADCATELAQLQGADQCEGVTVLASQLQLEPACLVSDGTTLFWTTGSAPGLVAMPVGGGSVTTLLAGPVNSLGPVFGADAADFCLAVDDTNLYLLEDDGVVRLPKNGAPATLVTEPGAQLTAVTALGSTLYWLEGATYDNLTGSLIKKTSVKSAPLPGGPITAVATFDTPRALVGIGVTDATVLLEEDVTNVGSAHFLTFPLSTGVPSGGPAVITVAAAAFIAITSDTDALDCPNVGAENVAISSDGTTTPLGPAVESSNIVFDDSFVYWADKSTVGTIMKAPKAGDGTATVLAHDTSPTGVAVDAHSVYWSDQAGYIKSVPK